MPVVCLEQVGEISLAVMWWRLPRISFWAMRSLIGQPRRG